MGQKGCYSYTSTEANRTLAGLRELSRQVLQEAAAADGECGCEGHGHGEAAGAGGDGCPCCAGGVLPGLGLAARRCCRPGGAGRPGQERIAAALGPAGRAGGGGRGAPPAGGSVPGGGAGRAGAAGRVPEEVAVTVAQIALEQATAAQQASWDVYGQRVAASAGRGVRGARPVPPEQAAAVRRARERLAAARKAARARPR